MYRIKSACCNVTFDGDQMPKGTASRSFQRHRTASGKAGPELRPERQIPEHNKEVIVWQPIRKSESGWADHQILDQSAEKSLTLPKGPSTGFRTGTASDEKEVFTILRALISIRIPRAVEKDT